ncbi:protein shisa-4-like [Ptychodera flava]|uniref:protein shisa-4-like n=1 Tax=Ptychodera flava TaxID=63121 RepID=UPI003969E0D5
MAGTHIFSLFTLVILAAVTCSVIADDTCYGYYDDNGDWHNSFDCDSIFDGGIYCCGTLTNKYCCMDKDDRITEEQLSAAIIAVIIVAVVVVVIIAIIIACCVCCCNACASCCRTNSTTTYVHGHPAAGPTVVVASSQQSSVTPGTHYAPTVADNPMYPASTQMNPVAGYPPPYSPNQKY